jgi:3-oxoacyl-[acyl-carrier protein] reductase
LLLIQTVSKPLIPEFIDRQRAKENGKFYTHPALQDVSPEALLKSKTSLQRLAQPEEIAATVAFLVSNDASYITGSTIAIDGGRL